VSVRVLSLQTPLLGNRTYGELLRRMFAGSRAIDFRAVWSPPPEELAIPGLRRLLWMRAGAPWIRERNLDFYIARFELSTSLVARAALRRRLSEFRPDVLHVHTQSIGLLASDIFRRIPSIVSADMTADLTAQQYVRRGWRWTFGPNRLLEGRAMRAAAAVVAFSAWAADAIKREHGVDNVCVIPPGVDVELFAAHARARRERPVSDPVRFLFVGSHFRNKGGDLLVETFLSRLADRNVELHLVSAQAPDPVHPRIVAHREVQPFSTQWEALYRDADVFVLPTRADATPFVFVEAMAAGLPVVGSRVGAIAEMIGEAGFVIDPGDREALGASLVRLADDAELRRRLGACGRARAEALFDARRNARRLEQLFVDVARGASAHASVSR
jgi:glycosyltransferase involved in cell wall biosynthesis